MIITRRFHVMVEQTLIDARGMATLLAMEGDQAAIEELPLQLRIERDIDRLPCGECLLMPARRASDRDFIGKTHADTPCRTSRMSGKGCGGAKGLDHRPAIRVYLQKMPTGSSATNFSALSSDITSGPKPPIWSHLSRWLHHMISTLSAWPVGATAPPVPRCPHGIGNTLSPSSECQFRRHWPG